jgi:hypothetical protein
MRLLACAIGLVAALLLALPALAQGGLVFLPSDQFGKVVVQLQNVLGRNANFEPLSKPSSRSGRANTATTASP